MWWEVQEKPEPNCQDKKNPRIATPVYRLRWKTGARNTRSMVPSRQASVQAANRVLGRKAVESKMLARRPKHIPVLKKESVRAALRRKCWIITNQILLYNWAIYLCDCSCRGPHIAKVMDMDWNTRMIPPERAKKTTTRVRKKPFLKWVSFSIPVSLCLVLVFSS